eukprot:TRINITY_DN63542_c0_g1_i1.p1 TRINITY_DN63542_c0_g1~~TRINITY_DN63542_c0_g1_i1.p1  ORF type:complete len:271 (-),score=48.44 TRINITY_DN63542_c0_g1_i1:102-914(-)
MKVCSRHHVLAVAVVLAVSATDTISSGIHYVETPMSGTKLNRYLFEGNVLQCASNIADHWVVLFCPHWYGLCQTFLPLFRNTSDIWQEKLNNNVMRSQARFGEVDCATDKELCNEQRIDAYPTVVHYFGGKRVSRWTAGKASDFEGVRRWVASEVKFTIFGGDVGSGTASEQGQHLSSAVGRAASKDSFQLSPFAFAVLFAFITGNVITVLLGAGVDVNIFQFLLSPLLRNVRKETPPTIAASVRAITTQPGPCDTMSHRMIQSQGTIDL